MADELDENPERPWRGKGGAVNHTDKGWKAKLWEIEATSRWRTDKAPRECTIDYVWAWLMDERAVR